MEDTLKKMNRSDFMEFFRDDDKLGTLSSDDRIEIFLQILPGGSDITKELLNELIVDYQVYNIKVSQIK